MLEFDAGISSREAPVNGGLSALRFIGLLWLQSTPLNFVKSIIGLP